MSLKWFNPSVLLDQAFAYDLSHMPTSFSQAVANLNALLPDTLHPLCQSTSVKKGCLIFETGKKPDWMFFVVHGEVTLERLSQHGDTVVLQRTRQGFVSEASLESSHYHCDARAVADSHIIQIPLSAMADALNKDPAFAGRWIHMLNQEVKRLRLQCERLNLKSVKDRVLHLLHTEGQNGQYQVNTGLKSLAGQLGVTHEALYRTLASLEEQAVITREAKSLRLA